MGTNLHSTGEGVMPQVRGPEPRPKSPINVPICPTCHAAMRLCTIEADTKYINLDVYFYACHCGESASQYVARVKR